MARKAWILVLTMGLAVAAAAQTETWQSAVRCPGAEETLVPVPTKPSNLRKVCSPLTLRALRTLRLGVKPLVVR